MAEIVAFKPASIDAAARATKLQRQAADPTVCAWVNASAGSGKTTVLRDRVLRLLLANGRPTGILCLTFTRAAAAEMANRIATQLREWAIVDQHVLIKDLERLTGARPPESMMRRAACESRPSMRSASRCCGASRWRRRWRRISG